MAVLSRLQGRIDLRFQHAESAGLLQKPGSSKSPQAGSPTRLLFCAPGRCQRRRLRGNIHGRSLEASSSSCSLFGVDTLEQKSRWTMKAVSAPPAPSKDFLPPPGDTETGWKRGIVEAERSINHALTDFVVILLDAFYADRHYARFYVLETIARVPYFSYVSVLHMYESFGWWRRADYIKVHFAESWNELHHLLIMESLGGDRRWIDRFLAQHVAVVYYFLCCVIYLASPRMAYHLMECVETHAYHTYDDFLKNFGEKLKTKPAPAVAVKYYTEGELYMFDEFQTAAVPGVRRPKIENLYDVFVNVRDDEGEHCKTMRACQTAGSLTSPHQDTPNLPGDLCSGVVECSTTAVSAADRYLKHGVPIDDEL